MILTHVSDIELYRGISANLDQALELLGRIEFDKQPVGRYVVSDKIFYISQEYITRPFEDTLWESHREYIDIQYVIDGIEKIGIRYVDDLVVTSPYDNEKDVVLYSGSADDQLTLTAGMLAIFFPADAHRPCIAGGKPSRLKKIVIKVAVE